jgi:ADP-dependent phosphofructokinase/glucokinase
VREEELDIDTPVSDERQLVVSILSFLKSGGGGERFVASPEIIESFARRFQCSVTLGGTPIRAAIALERLGYDAALHFVTMNEHVRRLMPRNCAYVASCAAEHIYPHLIVQFTEGAALRPAKTSSPRPNRIIYDNDPENVEMKLNVDFAKFCPGAKVFLISGSMRCRAPRWRRAHRRAAKNQKKLPKRPSSAMRTADLRRPAAQSRPGRPWRKSTSHGMNEDELRGIWAGRSIFWTKRRWRPR